MRVAVFYLVVDTRDSTSSNPQFITQLFIVG